MPETRDYRRYHRNPLTAEYYDRKTFAQDSYPSLLWKLEQDALVKIVGKLRTRKPHVAYLDFACGTGRVLSFLEDKVDEAYGIDFNRAMLDQARTKTTAATLVEGDLTSDGSLLDGQFDLITAFRFFLNAEPQLRLGALRALAAKLRDRDSILVFNVHSNKYSYAAVGILLGKFRPWKKTYESRNYLSLGDCKSLCAQCGLRIDEVKGVGFLSSKLVRFLNGRLCLLAERIMAKIPFLNRFAIDLILVCRRA